MRSRVETHRVSVQTWRGDLRPSSRCAKTWALSTEWAIGTTEHGAKCVFTREANTARNRLFQVGEEWLPFDAEKPDRKVLFIVTEYEGITRTDVIISERYPRYDGMYNQDAVNAMVNDTATRHVMDSEWD